MTVVPVVKVIVPVGETGPVQLKLPIRVTCCASLGFVCVEETDVVVGRNCTVCDSAGETLAKLFVSPG